MKITRFSGRPVLTDRSHEARHGASLVVIFFTNRVGSTRGLSLALMNSSWLYVSPTQVRSRTFPVNSARWFDVASTPPANFSEDTYLVVMFRLLGDFPNASQYWYSSMIVSPMTRTRRSLIFPIFATMSSNVWVLVKPLRNWTASTG